MFVDIGLSHYRSYKKYEYGKTKLPEEIEREDSEYEIKTHLLELENRVRDLERTSPLKLALYAIFIGVSLAVALYSINIIFHM